MVRTTGNKGSEETNIVFGMLAERPWIMTYFKDAQNIHLLSSMELKAAYEVLTPNPWSV